MNTTTITPFELYNAITDADLKPGPKVVLLALARFINWKRGDFIVWPSQNTIAEKARLDRHTVGKHLLALANADFIQFDIAEGNHGMRYNYEILVGEICANGRKPATPMAENLPQVGTKPTMKESKGRSKPEGLEDTSYRTSNPAGSSAQGKSEKDRESAERRLLQNFSTLRCRKDPKTRLRFYMECGRAFTNADHFHKPKDSQKPLTFSQGDSLRIWFEHLHQSGVEVMIFAMKEWQYLTSNPPTFKYGKTPTISALEKYGTKELLKEYGPYRLEQMLMQVEEHAPPIDDDGYDWEAV